MELKQIKDLMTAMGRSKIRRLRIKQQNFELELEHDSIGDVKGSANMKDLALQLAQDLKSVERKVHDIPTSLHPPIEQKKSPELIDGVDYVTSPMVGTFYSSPGPDEPSFVKVGDSVGKETVICIVEAMKVMNEVKSKVEGVVEEVLVENGHPVEFGTKLFKISKKL